MPCRRQLANRIIRTFLERTWCYFDRLQNGLIRPATFEFAQRFVENISQSQRSIGLLEMILIPIVKYSTNITVFQRRCFKYWRELAIDCHELTTLIQFLPEQLLLQGLRVLHFTVLALHHIYFLIFLRSVVVQLCLLRSDGSFQGLLWLLIQAICAILVLELCVLEIVDTILLRIRILLIRTVTAFFQLHKRRSRVLETRR